MNLRDSQAYAKYLRQPFASYSQNITVASSPRLLLSLKFEMNLKRMLIFVEMRFIHNIFSHKNCSTFEK